MTKPTYVASISGGKDSAAMSLWLTEQGIEHRRVFADTGWEHPDTYDYIRGPLQDKLGPIHLVRSPQGGFKEWVLIKGGFFPHLKRARWCTQKLKVEPLAAYMSQIPGDLINCVGIRAGESQARAKLEEWEDLPALFGDRPDRESARIWRPLISWSEQDVIDMHKRHGLQPNPLYLKGATRVGCWPCIFARKSEIRLVAELTPWRIDEIRAPEEAAKMAAEERYAKKDETFESLGYVHPSFFTVCVPGYEPINGREPGKALPTPIDEVVAWSKTSFGGRQLELMSTEEPGCVRWGMCHA